MRRLLHDVSEVDASLAFWTARLRSGQHRSFLLLGRGPASFAADVLAALRRSPDHRTRALSATDKIERKVWQHCLCPMNAATQCTRCLCWRGQPSS
jgi:hypothetical protein